MAIHSLNINKTKQPPLILSELTEHKIYHAIWRWLYNNHKAWKKNVFA
jgi:hypothetical protein